MPLPSGAQAAHMKKPLKETIRQNRLLRFFGNRYVIIALLFIAWMLFLDNYSYLDHRRLDKDIDELERNKKYYQNEIIRDEKHIRMLQDPMEVERYAREKYYMKRDSEDIYIIEYEGEEKTRDPYIPN